MVALNAEEVEVVDGRGELLRLLGGALVVAVGSHQLRLEEVLIKQLRDVGPVAAHRGLVCQKVAVHQEAEPIEALDVACLGEAAYSYCKVVLTGQLCGGELLYLGMDLLSVRRKVTFKRRLFYFYLQLYWNRARITL